MKVQTKKHIPVFLFVYLFLLQSLYSLKVKGGGEESYENEFETNILRHVLFHFERTIQCHHTR